MEIHIRWNVFFLFSEIKTLGNGKLSYVRCKENANVTVAI